jgi:hypothetical protein
MSIEPHPGKKPLVRPPPPSWGEIAPDGQTALVVRFALGDRAVTFPADEFKRWEHVPGEPELLTISTGKEQIVIEGRELAEVCAALDLGRLCEVRINFPRSSGVRPGPQVRRIAIEPA